MTPPDSDRGMTAPPCPANTDGTEDTQATAEFTPVNGARTVRAPQFEFLRPPGSEDELGWLAHYRVRSLIGQGAIGLVFLADDTQLSRAVALKVIRPELTGTARVRDRFVREAQATAAIKHDHIVTIYQVGQDNETQFLAMEYLKGISLQNWLERGRKPSIDLVLRLAREIASGLAAAHRNGLIHRDIKPANIWLEAPSGRVKILDFGMARSERDDVHITHSGTVVGTPAYMSPEQARGEAAGVGSDLFSLGCVIYRLCVGRSPFEGTTILGTLSALASESPRPLRDIDPELRPELEELVKGLLEKDPTARPASAQALVEAIRKIERELLAARQKLEVAEVPARIRNVAPPSLASVGVAERPDGIQPGPKSPHRARARSIVAAVLTLVGCVTFGAFVMARPRVSPAPTSRQQTSGAQASDSVTKDKPLLDSERGRDDLAKPEVHRVAGHQQDSNAPADKSTHMPQSDTTQTDGHSDVIDRAAVGQPDSYPARVEGKTEVDRAASVPSPFTEGVGQTESISSRPDWGKPIDPDGDCKIDLDAAGTEITISVPRTPHVLSAELGRLNAPRLLQRVRGDFDAFVTVAGVFHTAGRATMKEYAPYHGAGILLWQDDRNYVRLEIATDLDHNKTRCYANFELRRDGVLAASKGLAVNDGSTQLRLQRRGNEFRAAFSPDGVSWTAFAPLNTEFDDSLGVGVVAINTAAKPLKAEMKMFSITKKIRLDERREGTEKSGRPEARSSP